MGKEVSRVSFPQYTFTIFIAFHPFSIRAKSKKHPRDEDEEKNRKRRQTAALQ